MSGRRLFSRLILAFVAALPAVLPSAARALDRDHAYVLQLRMKSSTAGWLQVFGDVGQGFSPQRSAAVPLLSGDDIREYRLTLPTGHYVALRIDPNLGAGRYEIASAAILDSIDRPVVQIPLERLTPAYQLALVARSDTSLIVEAPTGANDPQLLYTPDPPLWLLPSTDDVPALIRRLLLQMAIAIGVVWLLELLLANVAQPLAQRLERWSIAAAAHPQLAVMIAAFVATLLSCYPTLLLDKSLVSPNNGQVPMLYGQPPLLFGTGDERIEEVRTSDVGATMWAFVPYSQVQRMAVADGELPLWNRYNSAGVALWGQGQSFVLDPLHWLTLIGPDPAPGWDLKFAAHRFVMTWGVGVAALLAVGAIAPAAIAAMAAAFLGFYVFRFNHPAIFALTYAPWILVGWFLLATATTRRAAARAALMLTLASSLLLVAAPPKEGTMSLVVAWSAGVLALLCGTRLAAFWRLRAIAASTAAIAFVLLTAPHWLVFLATLKDSVTIYDAPAVQFAGRDALLRMVVGSLAANPLGPGLQTATGAFLVATLLSPRLLLAHRAIFACVLASLAAIAIGAGVIPAEIILRSPLVANIHSLGVTLLTAAIVPLSVAAALGVHAILTAGRGSLTLFTVAIAIAAAEVASDIGGAKAAGEFSSWLILIALSSAVALPAVLRTAASSFPRLLPLVSAGALLLLLLSPGGQHLDTDTPQIDHVLLQPRTRVPLALASPVIDAISAAGTEPARVLGLGTNLFPSTAALHGLEGIEGPDALVSSGLRELIAAADAPPFSGWKRVFNRSDVDRVGVLLDMLNVRFVTGTLDELSPSDRTLPMHGPDRLQAVERPTAWPRAFFVDRVGHYAEPFELLGQVAAAGRPIAAILASDDAAVAATRQLPSGPAEAIAAINYRLTANTTTFHVRTQRAGVAVLAETYMPRDFIATLNGQPVSYFRVNHAFKGVAIPDAGAWDVRFEYRPRHWTLALALAVAGLFLLGGLAAVSLRSVRPAYNEKPAAFASS